MKFRLINLIPVIQNDIFAGREDIFLYPPHLKTFLKAVSTIFYHRIKGSKLHILPLF